MACRDSTGHTIWQAHHAAGKARRFMNFHHSECRNSGEKKRKRISLILCVNKKERTIICSKLNDTTGNCYSELSVEFSHKRILLTDVKYVGPFFIT